MVIGFRHSSQLRPVHHNLKLDYDNPQEITDYWFSWVSFRSFLPQLGLPYNSCR